MHSFPPEKKCSNTNAYCDISFQSFNLFKESEWIKLILSSSLKPIYDNCRLNSEEYSRLKYSKILHPNVKSWKTFILHQYISSMGRAGLFNSNIFLRDLSLIVRVICLKWVYRGHWIPFLFLNWMSFVCEGKILHIYVKDWTHTSRA